MKGGDTFRLKSYIMETKKHPHADLNRNSGLYFVIGLAIVLLVVWRLLEYKSYPETIDPLTALEVADELVEDVPITERIQSIAPPPPPAAPAVIEIVEDVEEIEETLIESTESGEDFVVADAIVDVGDVEVAEEEEEIVVPFAVIEDAPVFPGCETCPTKEEQKACFNQSIQDHIAANFQYPPEALELGIQGRVFLTFKIDANGKVTDIRKRGPNPLLEKEAVRIIASLPTMQPGKQRGRPVSVTYSLPIMFKLL